MAKVQKVSPKEFKEEAVKLFQSSGKPDAQIARDLGMSDNSLYNWQKQLAEKGADALPGKGHQSELEEKIGVEKENSKLLGRNAIYEESGEHLFTGTTMRYHFIE